MTGFAQRMGEAGYRHRVFAGKADFGMAYYKQSPMGRGYTDALFYFNHMNDYYSLNVGTCISHPPAGPANGSRVFQRDLYGTNPDGSHGPQYQLLNPQHCWVQNMTGAEDPVAPFPKSMDGCVCESLPPPISAAHSHCSVCAAAGAGVEGERGQEGGSKREGFVGRQRCCA